jgi:hypothetical protein
VKSIAKANKPFFGGLAWSIGDFHVPGFSSDGRTGVVPGAPDTHRRFFLIRARELEPELLRSLRKIRVGDKTALSAWARRWHLTDGWCSLLASDTLRYWAADSSKKGWNFESTGIFAGFFPFKIDPLNFGQFYHDPTWRRRRDFKRDVLREVNKRLEAYCDRVEADALAAGLKRAPRHRETMHFDWLVRYQVQEESYATIAKRSSFKFKGGRQTIHKAVVELAHYLELTLRRPSTSARTR